MPFDKETLQAKDRHYPHHPETGPALKRGIEMLRLAKGGNMVSFQNDEVYALLNALGKTQ